MDSIKANTKSPEAQQHKQTKVDSVIPQVSLTRTQFKETSIWDVSSQLMKLQPIDIVDTTTTVNEVLMLVEISSYGLLSQKFCLNSKGPLDHLIWSKAMIQLTCVFFSNTIQIIESRSTNNFCDTDSQVNLQYIHAGVLCLWIIQTFHKKNVGGLYLNINKKKKPDQILQNLDNHQ